MEYEVADVHAPLLSVSRMVDMGATVVFSPSGAHIHRPGKAPVPLVRRNNVYWLSAEVQEEKSGESCGIQPLCPLPEIDLDEPVQAQLVAGELGERARPVRAKRLPGEPDPEVRLQHELTHLPPRDWCEFCIAGRGKDDSHTRRKSQPGRIPEVQIDYARLEQQERSRRAAHIGTATTGPVAPAKASHNHTSEPKTVAIAHGIDTELGNPPWRKGEGSTPPWRRPPWRRGGKTEEEPDERPPWKRRTGVFGYRAAARCTGSWTRAPRRNHRHPLAVGHGHREGAIDVHWRLDTGIAKGPPAGGCRGRLGHSLGHEPARGHKARHPRCSVPCLQ